MFVFVLANSAGAAWCCIVFPGATQRSRRQLENKFYRCLLNGLLVLAFCAALFIGFLSCRSALVNWFSIGLDFFAVRFGVNRVANDAMMLAHLVGWGLVCPLLATGLIGLAAGAEIFSAKLLARKQSPFSLASILYGSAMPLLTCCIPIVGWFFVAPMLTLACLGSGFHGVFNADSRDNKLAASK